MTESQIQKEIIEALKLHGALVFRLNSGSRQKNVKLCPSGTPDILAILPHKTLWIEVKTEKGILRPSQEKMISELIKRGQIVLVARSVDQVIEEIKDV